MTSQDYLLGHDEAEVKRLEDQARILGPATRTILKLDGIEPGMRVLDLGSGPGDVAFEVADIVGPGGSVVGIDRSPEAIARARRRSVDCDVDVTFVEDDIATADVDGPFDAVVGRLVLLYMPDPALVLKRYAALLRPGGVVVAMEYEMLAAGSLPRLDLMDRVISWIVESFEVEAGLDTLTDRVADELTSGGAMFKPPTLVGGWATVA